MGEADKIDLEEFRRDFEALGRRDWDRAQRLHHPDIVWHDPPEFPDAEVRVGREAVRRFYEEAFDALERWHLEVEDLTSLGDWILSVYRFRGKARYTGIEADLKMFHVFRSRTG